MVLVMVVSWSSRVALIVLTLVVMDVYSVAAMCRALIYGIVDVRMCYCDDMCGNNGVSVV